MKHVAPRWADWKNHFAYHYIHYIVLIVVLCLGWSMLFDASEPETPMDQRMELLFVALHDHEEVKTWVTGIQGVLQGEGQEASYLTVPSPNAMHEEASSSVILFTYMESRSGDLLFLPHEWFSYLAGEGALIPLTREGSEGVPLTDHLTLPEGFDADYGYAYYQDPETNEITTELCGIPMETFGGFRDLGIDPSGYVACIPFYCENQDNAMRALNWIMEHKAVQTNPYWFPFDTPLGDD